MIFSLQGHGIMVFEDGTHYEGELKQTGVFGGKGVLTFPSGDYIDGTLYGTWTEGIKVTGLLHKAFPSSYPRESFSEPKLAVNIIQIFFKLWLIMCCI